MADPIVEQPVYYPDAPSPIPAPSASPTGNGPDYSYTVVDFPAPPPNSPLQAQNFPYTIWAFREFIVGDPGLRANAIQGPAGSAMDILRVHGGSAEKVIAFVARRYGADPQVPTRTPTVANDVPAPWVLTRSLVGFLPDGTPCVEISGAYKYFLQAVPSENDPANLAAPPYSNAGSSQYQTGSGVFSTGIYQGVQPAGAPGLPITF